MSGSVYDTAWVSMVKQDADDSGESRWLFPECFEAIKNMQLPDGGWPQFGDPFDRVQNSLASLLSLSRHNKTLSGVEKIQNESQISRATTFLDQTLQDWDLARTDYVGFEYLIPSLLKHLESEDIRFDFPAKALLLELSEKKMAKFDPAVVYNRASTRLHVLEGFVGKLDFDKLGSHVVHGSLMASPSSTAAYLMNTSRWNEECEEYLRHVVRHCRDGAQGLVPGAFPITIFELSWVRSSACCSRVQ